MNEIASSTHPAQASEPPSLEPPAYPTFREAFYVWLKIGCLSFGGPAGQIALMHQTLIEEKRWISETRFLHALNYCMLLPGPEAQQLAIYIGWLLHGVRGGLVAGALFALPGLLVILVLSSLYVQYSGIPAMDGLFFGLKAAVLAIVLGATIRVGQRALKNRLMVCIAALAFVAIFAFAVPFPVIIFTAGIAGYIGARFYPDIYNASGHEGGKLASLVTLELTEPVARQTFARAAKLVLFYSIIWFAPVLAAIMVFGYGSLFSTIGFFFSKMAIVTFGGAYAVLAYVAQEAVQHFNWLKPGEMLDGLALAETTPGPLILVLSFVGFVAAYRNPGSLDPLLAGFLGALLTTWVTFLPCYLWIFLGGPYVERLRNNKLLTGALTAITAAVVGVILNLAIWFGINFLFSKTMTWHFGPLHLQLPWLETLDPIAAILTIFASVLLLRFKFGVPWVLLASAGSGLLLKFAVSF